MYFFAIFFNFFKFGRIPNVNTGVIANTLCLFFFKKHIAFEIIQHALGIKTKVMQDSIPESAQSKAIFNSRIYLFIWLSIILWAILATSWLPILYFLLPQFYGKTLHKLVAFTQHAGLARNVKDHRLTSREMYLNPVLSFLYWKMEYHLWGAKHPRPC